MTAIKKFLNSEVHDFMNGAPKQGAMNCTICKTPRTGKKSGKGLKWATTSARTPLAGVKVIFKLFEVTRREFAAGPVCPLCFSLVVQIESLEYQLKGHLEDEDSDDGEGQIEDVISETGSDGIDFPDLDDNDDIDDEDWDENSCAKKKRTKGLYHNVTIFIDIFGRNSHDYTIFLIGIER